MSIEDNSKPFVTVIATFYNLEDLAPRCVSSILNQTYENMEVVLVDDGSTDSTKSVLQSFANDTRVRLLSKSNGGAASARNFGVENASYEWISFVDGDDYLSPYAIESLVEAQTATGADMVYGSYTVLSERKAATTRQEWQKVSSYSVITDKDLFVNFMYQRLDESSWGKLAKRSFYQSTPFPNDRYYEDLAVGGKHLHDAHTITLLEGSIYGYVMRVGSVVHRKHATIKQAEDFEWAINEMLAPFEADIKTEQDKAGMAYRRALAGIRLHTLLLSVVGNPEAVRKLDKRASESIRYYVKNYGDDTLAPRANMLRFKLFNISPKIYDVLIRTYDRIVKGI